jgi:hypothetical protein
MGRKPVRPIVVNGDVACITLTQGKKTIVDACEVSRVNFNWIAQRDRIMREEMTRDEESHQ